ncbi:MAG: hypothetical protein PUC15_02955 [Lentisphaeria bacterium]|nr:hypothetical protein [Lentisphaeria bacterium]
MQKKPQNNIEAETAPAVPANGNSHAESGEIASAWDWEPPSERRIGFVPPSALVPGGHDAESVDAEVVDADDVGEGSDTADNMAQAQWGIPRLRYPLTAETLFRLARSVSACDSARIALGYRYEFELKRECAITLAYPIYKNDLTGLWIVICHRRNNWGFFRCAAIDAVLNAYWNDFTKAVKR